jgi:hypothetical protein
MMNVDSALLLAGIVTQAVVVGLLLYRHVWRTLPIFCVFCAWNLLGDGGGYLVFHFFPSIYTPTYLVVSLVDSVLELSVLIELAWSVLLPIRATLPRGALAVVAVLILAAGAVIWPLSGIHEIAGLSLRVRIIMHAQQTSSILRVLFFLILAGFSQLLSIGWRNRELQVATGLGFFSLVSLAAAVVHSHQTMRAQYEHLNQFVVVSYVCSLLYWAFSFAQQEAERREFTPRMQGFLLAVAGVAKANRIALTNSMPDKSRSPREQ